MIYIFTGKIRSGKTSKLREWVEKSEGVGGILMPVISGKRYFLNISSGDLCSAEADEKEKEVIRIGPHRFSGKGFDLANKNILDSIKKSKVLIIDEIGRIELNNKGFVPSLNIIMNDKKELNKIDLILVVREGLVKQVTEKWEMSGYKIITSVVELNELKG